MPTNTDPAAVTDMARRREATTFHGDEAQFWVFDLADGGRVHIPPDQVRRLWNAEQLQQQLKGCECPARKALQRMMDEHGHDCDCIPRVLCEYCEGRAALSAPCPCEELREQRDSQHQRAQALQDVLLTEIVRADKAEAERDSLRAENEQLRKSVLNQCGDNLCWPEAAQRAKALPEAEFLESCRRYRNQIATERGELSAGQMTIAQLEAENERLKRSLDWITAEKHGAQADAEREKNVADSLRAELAEARAELDEHKSESWCFNESHRAFVVRGNELSADLAASQERERLLREALAALIDTAKSYRSDILGLSWDGVEIHGDPRWKPYFHHVKRVDRDTVIDEADAALATPEGTVRP